MKVDDLMAEFQAYMPTKFYPCAKGCGQEIAAEGEPCWDCQRVAERAAQARERYERSKASVPAAFLVSLDAPKLVDRVPRHLIDLGRSALASRNVAIVGAGSGIGKTSLLAAMVLSWLHRRDAVAIWATAFDVADRMHMPEEWTECDLLAVDDIGSERQMASSLLPALLNARYESGKAMWFTTPLNQAGFAHRYGDNNRRRAFHQATIIDFSVRS